MNSLLIKSKVLWKKAQCWKFKTLIGLLALIIWIIHLFLPTPIPKGKTVVTPIDDAKLTQHPACDIEGENLVRTFKLSKNGVLHIGTTIQVDGRILSEFSGPNRELFLRHLATSIKWRLIRDPDTGKLFATRRFVVGGRWNSLRGSTFSGYDFSHADYALHGNNENEEWNITLSPDGPVVGFYDRSIVTYVAAPPSSVALRVVKDNINRPYESYTSYLVLGSNRGAVQIMENSTYGATNRPFTPAALATVNNELKAILASPSAKRNGFDLGLMPPESIRIGKPCLTLTRLEEGLYRICAYVNPREQGSVYFKVFDMSKSSYSKDAEPGAPEYIGWSDNPNQLFFCDAYQRIWYGNPNKLFPARIELWFKPDSGKPDRKLYEDYFYTSGCRG